MERFATLTAFLCMAFVGLGATPAEASSFLDVSGTPLYSDSHSSFSGIWNDGDGTFDISIGPGLGLFDDGVRWAILGDALLGSDNIVGAQVDIDISFVGGSLDGTATNNLKIWDGDNKIFYEQTIWMGSFEDKGEFSDGEQGFSLHFMTLPGGTLNEGAGGGDLGSDGSEWIDALTGPINASGMEMFFMTGIADFRNANLDESSEVTLANINGKLTPNPEPGSLLLVLLGLGAGIFTVRRRRSKALA